MMASEKKVLDNIVNVETLKNKLERNSWVSLEDLLHSSAIQLQAEDKRKELSPQILDSFVEVLEICVTLINENKDRGQNILIECFRNLRNSCVSLTINQDYLVNHKSALDDTCRIINILLNPSQEFNSTCLKVAIQFLGNLIVDNNNAKLKVWEKCSKLLMILLKNEDVAVANFASMVLYNILLSYPKLGSEINKDSLENLLNLSGKESEYAVYIIELLVRNENYLESLYKDLENEHKLLILDMLHHVVGQKSGKDSESPLPDLHPSVLKFIAQLFKEHCFLILKTVDKYVEQLEPREVARLMDILSSATGQPQYLEELQKDKSLLIDCTFLLKSMHNIGLESENHFSVIPKLSELNLKGKDYELQQHPAFGFKSSLIQLIGNMCWKHKVNQDQVLELEGIQLLLDCCKIDARNPLMQWAILAVRNLCDSNKECQAVVAGLTKKGEIDAATLNKLGLTLNEGPEGAIGIVPLQR